MNKDKILLQIAREHLLHDENATLEARGRDRLDFHDVGVVGIKAALEAAYEAGRKSALDEKAKSAR